MDPFKRIVEPSLESMEKLFSKIDDEIICFGHHHPVHLFQNSNRIFINPGALGCSVKSIANYGLITISERAVDVEFKEVHYNKTALLFAYEELNVPDRDFLINAFHGVRGD